MCFSAPVSFIASSGLAVVGAASLREAKKQKDRRMVLVAVIPLFFAIQQAFEGIQWLSDPGSLPSIIAGYGFLFFAFLVWPTYIPLMVYILDRKRRAFLRWFLVLGVMVTLSLLIALIISPLSVHVVQQSIDYRFFITPFSLLVLFYLTATCGSLMFSSDIALRVFGFAALCSAMLAAAFFRATFISVWCFFVALMSVYLYAYIRYIRVH